MLYNPSIAFLPDLFLKLFQDFHCQGKKICVRSGTNAYPDFILNGDLASLNIEFPRFITSPILKIPVHLRAHFEVRHEQVAQFDAMLRQLYGVVEESDHLTVNPSAELSVASRVLRTLILSMPESSCSFHQITTYLSPQQDSLQPNHDEE